MLGLATPERARTRPARIPGSPSAAAGRRRPPPPPRETGKQLGAGHLAQAADGFGELASWPRKPASGAPPVRGPGGAGRKKEALVACDEAGTWERPAQMRAAWRRTWRAPNSRAARSWRTPCFSEQVLQRIPTLPHGHAAPCDIARKIGDSRMLATCLDDLRRMAPDHEETRRALQRRCRPPPGRPGWVSVLSRWPVWLPLLTRWPDSCALRGDRPSGRPPRRWCGAVAFALARRCVRPGGSAGTCGASGRPGDGAGRAGLGRTQGRPIPVASRLTTKTPRRRSPPPTKPRRTRSSTATSFRTCWPVPSRRSRRRTTRRRCDTSVRW